MTKGTMEWRDAAIEAVIVIIILFLFFWPVKISGDSMETTYSNNDKVIISRMLAQFNRYDKGDIVVFSILENGKKIDVIKRVIAQEGDTVKIKDNQVYVNGILLEETYVTGKTQGDVDLTVEEGCIFVMGDNREHSSDSREFGTIKKSDVIGKTLLRFYPLDKISFS